MIHLNIVLLLILYVQLISVLGDRNLHTLIDLVTEARPYGT